MFKNTPFCVHLYNDIQLVNCFIECILYNVLYSFNVLNYNIYSILKIKKVIARNFQLVVFGGLAGADAWYVLV
jgi:hypothetical protein